MLEPLPPLQESAASGVLALTSMVWLCLGLEEKSLSRPHFVWCLPACVNGREAHTRNSPHAARDSVELVGFEMSRYANSNPLTASKRWIMSLNPCHSRSMTSAMLRPRGLDCSRSPCKEFFLLYYCCYLSFYCSNSVRAITVVVIGAWFFQHSAQVGFLCCQLSRATQGDFATFRPPPLSH